MTHPATGPAAEPATGPRPVALDAAPRHSPWDATRRSLTAGLLLTVTLAAFEALAIATAMPVVGRDLGYLSLYGWVFSGFMLGDLIGIVLAGILVDRRGLVLPYVLGLGLFGAGLAIGGLAPSMPVLVAARVLQGVGGGAIPTTAYVAIQREYEAAVRPRMFAYLSTAWVLPGLVGPALAGVVAVHVSWRAVFLGLLPLAVVALALTVPSLRRLAPFVDEDEPLPAESATLGEPATPTADRLNDRAGGLPAAGGRSDRTPAPADPLRLLLAVRVAVGAGLLLAAVESGQVVTLAVLAVGGVFIGLPALLRLLPAGALRLAPGLPATVTLRGVLTFGFTGTEAYLPLMLVTVHGIDPSLAGLTLTAATITWAMGSWLQSHWYTRVGPRLLLGIGFTIVTAGIGILVVDVAASLGGELSAGVALTLGVLSWAVTGAGMGMCYPAQTLSVMEFAAPREQGAATASLNLSDVVGTALGAGVGGALLALGTRFGWTGAAPFLVVFSLMTGVVGLGAMLTGRVRAPRAAGG